MKAENKKYLIYGGVAFLVGSLAYFVYTTFKNKNSNVEEKETVTIEGETTSKTNFFSDMLNNTSISTNIDFPIIKNNLNNNPFTKKSVLL